MSFIIIPMFVGMFLLLGKIVQTKYRAFDTNPYITIPLGFIIFSTITLFTYIPLIILRLPGVVFIVFEVLKDFSIFIVIWMQRKNIKSNINYLRFFGVLVGVVIVATAPSLLTLIKDGNDYPFHLSRENNVYMRMYNQATQFKPWTNSEIYNSWYMFNSIIIDLFKINGDFEVWWIQSYIISFVAVNTILSLIQIAFKKIRFVGLFIGIFLLSIIILQSANIWGFHSHAMGLIITNIILLIVSWELIQKPRVRYMLLTGLTSFTMLSFGWSSLWLYSTYMFVFIGVYIYKEKPKPTLLILFTIMFVGFMIATSLHRFTNIGSTIGMVIAAMMGMFFIWIRNKSFEISVDHFIVKFKKWLLPVAFSILVIISMSLWLSNPNSDWWLNFKINYDYLNVIKAKKSWTIFLYVLYWFALTLGFIVLIFSIKIKKTLEIDSFLILIGLISTLLFFSPFTATLMKTYLIPKEIFLNLHWSTLAPLFIGLILKLGKVIAKRIKGENSEIVRAINV